MGLEEYRSKYAQEVTSYANAWVSNTAGIRDSFTNALQNLQLHWSQTLAPTLVGATVGAQSATQSGVLAASQGLYDAIKTQDAAISGAMQGVTGMGQSMMGMCHGAAACFGWFTPDWYRARNWIVSEWRGFAANMFRAFYRKYSRNVAWLIHNVPGMRALWTPFFKWAARNGSEARY